MPAFEYLALDPDGRRLRGTIEGDSDRQARTQLRGRGLTLLRIQSIARRESPSFAHLFAPRVSDEELALITRLLATLVRSGLPLEEVLLALSMQTEHAALRRMLVAVRARVLEGHSLGQAFAQFPQVFPELYLATVSAGEQTPYLDVVLERLADYIEERRQLKQRIQMAMMYPMILTVTSVLIVTGLLTLVVPEIVKVFAHLDRQLPVLTRCLIAVAGFTRQWGLALVGGLVAAAVAIRLMLKGPAARRRLHRALLAVPVLGRLIREADTARFTRTLGILLRSGVTLIEALRISNKAMTSLPLRDAVAAATIKVQEGTSLNQALRGAGHMPALSLHLIASGETGGNLEEMLETAARTHERNVQATLATMLALLEPLLILTMGLIVLLIVVAIMLPIFDLNKLV